MKSRILPVLLLLLLLPLASHGQQTQSGAKDLFNKQLASPKQVLNTGIQYWIELKRAGQSSKVNNKFVFKSGDSIRVHLKSNSDAYAYIVLVEGSRGEQSVLFPDARYHDKNQVMAGKDYAIPADGFLTFDQNPGTEKLLILLSRQAVQAQKYLADKSRKRVVIASGASGAKDLIPGSVVLAYSEQSTEMTSMDAETAQRPQDKTQTIAENSSPSNSNITTFVQTDPSQILVIDLALAHKSN